jgi:hypothetical protein
MAGVAVFRSSKCSSPRVRERVGLQTLRPIGRIQAEMRLRAGRSRRPSLDLDVPARYAFDFLADPGTATVIDPAIREYRPDSLPMRLGTRNVIRMRMSISTPVKSSGRRTSRSTPTAS